MNSEFSRICVFCGSSFGRRDAYGFAAESLGRQLAEKDLTLVFGGGDVGLMGRLSRAVLAHNGRAIGVIPKAIHEKVGTTALTQLHVVEDMHQRKSLMYRLSDAFIALPGGLGTVEELMEAFTWYQLGFHLKPIGFLDIEGYFSHLEKFLHHMVQEGFLKADHLKLLLSDSDPARLLSKMQEHQVRYIEKL